MRARNTDLHGSAPDKSRVALLLIDVVNDLDFPGSTKMVPKAVAMARRLATFKTRAKKSGIPIIYVNDNFGRWQSDFTKLVDHCMAEDSAGRRLVELLHPGEDDYFVLKPKHSGFFSTSLDILLEYLAVETLILTGIAGNICVLYTANDAYMRDLELFVPSDCCISNSKRENDYALDQMKRFLKADIRPSFRINLDRLRRKTR